jgi:alcohol dehydrogenase
MKALVYYGPGKRAWEDVPDPVVTDPEDAVVRVDAFMICGTDLHILRGDVPEVEPGRVLGHEAVGTVTAVGDGVRTVRAGARVLMSCISSCGRCRFCREGRYGQCQGGGGWVLGHLIDGVQAGSVRIPFADGSVHRLPEGSPTTGRSCSPTSCPPRTRSGPSTAPSGRATPS